MIEQSLDKEYLGPAPEFAGCLDKFIAPPKEVENTQPDLSR